MMPWLPAADGFRESLKLALESSDRRHSGGMLVALAQHDLDYTQTVQLDKVMDRLELGAADRYIHSRIAVLSSSTADHLVPGIRAAGLRRGDVPEIYLCQYGQYRQELLDPSSPLHTFAPEFVVCANSAADLLGPIAVDTGSADADQHIENCIEGLVALWDRAQNALGATVLQQTLLNHAEPLFGSFDRVTPGAPARLIRAANERIVAAAADRGVSILDLDRAVERHGLAFWFDTGRWLQARMEIAPRAVPLYGELIARIIAAHQGRSRKCLVLDLDNTLWGGVVGDDGIDGLILGEGSGHGEAFLAFQKYAKQLASRGVILAVCSKNQIETAEAVFSYHPEMVLKRSDFAAFVANWKDKAANLERIAKELNIGIDSLVFVDDNPAERARVRQSLPAVAVPELPEDPALFVDRVASGGYFESVSFTAEDAIRSRQYSANASRRALETRAESLDDYLMSLAMSVTSGPFRPVDMQRVTQLINKTNQFNTTMRRLTADEIQAMSADPANVTMQFRLSDRFGDNGLVSAVILVPAEGAAGTLDIDTWVMSCRVFGRGLESEVLNQLITTARQRNASSITARYVPGPRNGFVEDLYRRLGFSAAPTPPDTQDGETWWQQDVAGFSELKTHISTETEAA